MSVPSAFARLGLGLALAVCAILTTLGVYTGYVVGLVKLKHPEIQDYPQAVGLLFGRVGAEITNFLFIKFLVLTIGSSILTGVFAIYQISRANYVCAIVFGAVATTVIVLAAIPPSLKQMTWLCWIDFASIVVAICVTIIALWTSTCSRISILFEFAHSLSNRLARPIDVCADVIVLLRSTLRYQ